MLVTALVTRTELSLSDLSLESETNGYRIVGMGPGPMTWRREYAMSSYTHGRALVGAVRDIGLITLDVRVKASNYPNLETRVAALLRAFDQFSYNLQVSAGGSFYTWKCEPADYSPAGDAGQWDKFQQMSVQQVYRFQIPRHPIPSDGAM